MDDLTLLQIGARLIRGEYLPRAGSLPQYEIARLEEAHKLLGLSVRRESDRLRDEARAEVVRLTRERDEARAEVERLREQMDAERSGFDAFADLQRAKLESAREQIAGLRRLALVPMAPGEVPTEPGWYVVDSGKPVQVWLDDCDNFGGTQEPFVWDVDAQCAVPATDWAGRWLARIPVEALPTGNEPPDGV
jgi:hypothetical protein